MSDAKLVNIARLMTTYNFEIEQLPDNLKCAHCKLVLKDACQLPCCCRYCRACIDNMMAKGDQFCPADSEDCGESLLSRFVTDYTSNKGVSRLDVKCPHDGCVHECRLANIKKHLCDCPRKGEECPFRELGCTQDKLAAEEMGGHLQHDNRRHSEILIRMITNICMEIETLKQRDEASSREIETLKSELVLKDEQISSIMDQVIHVHNDIKSIKEENEYLAGQVRILTEKIERETAERHENGEQNSVRMIEHVDREIAVVTRLIGSNEDKSVNEMQSVKADIGSISQCVKSIKDDICAGKSQMESIQALVGLGQFDASCVWLIGDNIVNIKWSRNDRMSEYFTGALHKYKYRLASANSDIATTYAVLHIRLHMVASPNDEHLVWPFEARVVITVTDRDRREACRSISRQCRIERPPDHDFRLSEAFVFRHSDLIKAGLNLSRGVRVSCVIVPGTGQCIDLSTDYLSK